ncbi:hypothetical protein EX30DRAFT_341164 [Ascodesmis nigricans]|uniref:Uncharacterized protein n=1 Tax=Ascodesmis nigricans TaxID=341454 RepID=A0A4V6RHE7_9PEZI|nr:hypothetical protein EX30DRAFT_341164 [Ascodesmis nigricans]
MAATTTNHGHDVEAGQQQFSKRGALKSLLRKLPLPFKVILILIFPIAGIVLMVYPNNDVDFGEACRELAKANGTVSPKYCSAKFEDGNPPAPELWATYESIINMPVCNGYQSSSPEQWLDPMASWVLPVLGLLLMIPVSQRGITRQRESRKVTSHERRAIREAKRKEWQAKHGNSRLPVESWGGHRKLVNWRWLIPGHVWEFKGHARGWLKILADPGSAFCGTFSELARDVTLIKGKLNKLQQFDRETGRPIRNPTNDKKALVARLCILMGQVEWTEDTSLALEFLNGYSGALPLARDTVRVLVGGRVRLMASVVLPVAFYTGSAVTAYYKASVSEVGDNDTAHMIAYGIWFLFILAIAVLANCSHLNADTVQSALQVVLQHCVELSPPGEPHKPHPHPQIQDMQIRAWKALFPDELGDYIIYQRFTENRTSSVAAKAREIITELQRPENAEKYAEIENKYRDLGTDPFRKAQFQCQTTKLQSRYIDSLLWMRWYEEAEKEGRIDVDLKGVLGPIGSPVVHRNLSSDEYRYYLEGQILSWIPVGISCGCAAAISFTTPKVALSCRSLNHIFYAFGTFVMILLRPTLYQLKHVPERPNFKPSGMRKFLIEIVTALSSFFSHFNIFLITWGTIFQISGLYRNCVCKVGLTDSYRAWVGRPDAGKALTQWMPDTWEHRYWARKVWVPVQVSSWAVFLLLCLISLGMKEWVSGKVRGRDFGDQAGGEQDDQSIAENSSGRVQMEEKPGLAISEIQSSRGSSHRTGSYS